MNRDLSKSILLFIILLLLVFPLFVCRVNAAVVRLEGFEYASGDSDIYSIIIDPLCRDNISLSIDSTSSFSGSKSLLTHFNVKDSSGFAFYYKPENPSIDMMDGISICTKSDASIKLSLSLKVNENIYSTDLKVYKYWQKHILAYDKFYCKRNGRTLNTEDSTWWTDIIIEMSDCPVEDGRLWIDDIVLLGDNEIDKDLNPAPSRICESKSSEVESKSHNESKTSSRNTNRSQGANRYSSRGSSGYYSISESLGNYSSTSKASESSSAQNSQSLSVLSSVSQHNPFIKSVVSDITVDNDNKCILLCNGIKESELLSYLIFPDGFSGFIINQESDNIDNGTEIKDVLKLKVTDNNTDYYYTIIYKENDYIKKIDRSFNIWSVIIPIIVIIAFVVSTFIIVKKRR